MSSPSRFQSAAALSNESNLDAAVADVADRIEAQLDGAAPDLTFLFATHHYGGDLARAGAELVEATGTDALAGCTGAWTIASGREEENGPGLAALSLTLDGTDVRIERVTANREESSEYATLDVERPEASSVILVADPFTFDATAWIDAFDREHAGVGLIGGLSSGGIAPGQNVLFAGSDPVNSGGIAVVLEGGTRVVSAVSQGCRPIGPPLVATRVDANVVRELRGQPAAKVMFEMLESLEESERALFQRGAFVGRAIDASKSRFGPGDLLVRGIMGLDPQKHALVIADPDLRAGMTLQFMVRDAESAADDLRSVLEVAGLESAGEAFGGLMFTCTGRGQGMFGDTNHDAGAVEAEFGPGFPLAGFSANGEIGPVAGKTFLHGFTASTALFAPRN